MGSPNGLRKGSWTEEEGNLLRKYVDKYGQGNWKHIPTKSGKQEMLFMLSISIFWCS
ncbi:hypothetical protein HYC85_020909 [Camellia sinensis]|uniref:Uncharacterized protein n=1 Tax=Camellia sinensis TaxID=4442 RepID=A0A7J7GS50_CAMSI|nr:hypothetical protein HYC85_020909 [Camellia sinensis]